MQKIAIYGAGGFGRETRLLIEQINAATPQWEFVGFFDDHVSDRVIGNMDALNQYSEELCVVVAIADPAVRQQLVQRINNANVTFPAICHPSVLIDSKEVSVGEGTIITANNVFTTNIALGKHVIVNLACTIGHDVIIGDFGSVMPGVHVSGNIRVGEGVLIGTGARILQNLQLGENSKIGAGAVVTKDVEARTTVVGIPAKQKD